MMKYFYLIICICLFSPIQAQKHDYNWLFGYNYDAGTPEAEGMHVNFNTDSFAIQVAFRNMALGNSTTAFSDSLGNLLLYTNGCIISDGVEDTIENSASLSPGQHWDVFCNTEHVYKSNVPQYGFFLGMPNDPHRVVLFHTFDNQFIDSLQYSILEYGSGKWRVVEKNNTFHFSQTPIGGMMTVKHGNGRDVSVRPAASFPPQSTALPLHRTKKVKRCEEQQSKCFRRSRPSISM